MGFNIFAIEANMPEAYRLNDYVLTGRGDPKTLLKGMYFWTWNTQEVLDMILWMRDFNESGKGRVQFTGFDMQTTTVAVRIVQDFVRKFDTRYEAQLTIASQHAAAAKELVPERKVGAGIATASIPISVAAGKKLRFSGYIKTEGITSGWAGLWWRVDGKSGTLVLDNMKDRGATGTTDWKRYEIDLPVASYATQVLFGVLNSGNGEAWFDGLTIELDGKPYQTDAVDLGFESFSNWLLYIRQGL
jgi:hypothetical protein